MEEWVCTVYGYIYDPTGGIEPRMSFADLPEDWVCPECSWGKDLFERTLRVQARSCHKL
ncbi:rubredoxin [Candidatus Bipolaricaulota bacterium]|nr:rubredoxin [Candidatus Bipolaricaulota bacterium]